MMTNTNHNTAINTVAAFSGLDVEVVAASFEKRIKG